MKKRRKKAKNAKVKDGEKPPVSKQPWNLWQSVMKWFSTVLNAPTKRPKRSASSASDRAEQAASRLNGPQSNGGRRPGQTVGQVAKQAPPNKLKTSPRQQQVPVRHSPGAPSMTQPKLQGPRLIDRVLKSVTGGSRNPSAPARRTSTLSRKSAKRHRVAPNPGASSKRSGNPPPTGSKVDPRVVLKTRTAPPAASNRRIPNRDGSQSKQRIGADRTPVQHPQKPNEEAAYLKVLQQAASHVLAPANTMLGLAAGITRIATGQRDSNRNKAHQPDQGPPTPIQDAKATTPESSDPDPRSDPQQFDEPATSQCGGWPTSTHSIADARFNNAPKRPLKPIR